MASKVLKNAVRPPNAGKGRVKGVPNKLNAAVKDMVLQALNDVGGVSYLAEQAEKNPKAFLSLVGRLVPLNVTADVATSITKIELVAPGQSG